MRHEDGRRCRTDSGNDTPGEMKLPHRFDQQRAVAKALRALNAARQDNDIEIVVRHFHQRGVGQQLHAARAGNRQVAVAGDAGGGDLNTATH